MSKTSVGWTASSLPTLFNSSQSFFKSRMLYIWKKAVNRNDLSLGYSERDTSSVKNLVGKWLVRNCFWVKCHGAKCLGVKCLGIKCLWGQMFGVTCLGLNVWRSNISYKMSLSFGSNLVLLNFVCWILWKNVP